MTQIGGPKHEPIPIGDEAEPPFSVAPDAYALFKRRAARLDELSAGHELGGYLSLIARIADAQDAIAAAIPDPQPKSASELARARDGGMPPLEAPGRALIGDAAFRPIRHEQINPSQFLQGRITILLRLSSFWR